ncbi:MAG: DUF975 family protein, partial [Leptospirales bacterium]|nr:DUF975 family protein [Leptospirales bacterium]
AFAIFILFLIYLPNTIISILDSFLKIMFQPLTLVSTLSIVLSIVMLVVKGPFALGLAGYFLKRVRGEEFSTINIFDGFKRFFPSFLLMFFTILFVILWSLLLIIPGIIKSLSYSMAFYIMYDNPEISALKALKKSKIMMKGYKLKLFLLFLSFIGWVFLTMLTLGIGYFWLIPYINLSIANFYENLKTNQEENQRKEVRKL